MGCVHVVESMADNEWFSIMSAPDAVIKPDTVCRDSDLGGEN